MFRDLIPRRHATLPYAMDASPEIVSQAGPSLKHSLSYEYRTNGRLCDDWLNPTYGVDVHSKVEVAGPPGDVGFVKLQGGASLNVPLPASWAFHGAFQTGILRSLSFGGLCEPAGVSDRFFLGGPMHFRGFVPAGIGPRAKTVSEVCLHCMLTKVLVFNDEPKHSIQDVCIVAGCSAIGWSFCAWRRCSWG